MVKVKDEAEMAEAKPQPQPPPTQNHPPTQQSQRKNRFHAYPHHHHHLAPFQHFYHHQCTYMGELVEGNGAASPAKFNFGPGFEPQSQPALAQSQNEYVVLFHVNPGVTINLQIGDNLEILTGEFESLLRC